MHQTFVYCGGCGYRRAGSVKPEKCPICGASAERFRPVTPTCPPHSFGEQVCTAPVMPVPLVEEDARVGDLLRDFPALAAVFTGWGIDLTRSMHLTIAQAAEENDADVKRLLFELNEVLCSPTGT